MSSVINQATGLAAGLNENQWSQINQATASLNPQQLTWLSGYLAGMAQNGQSAVLSQPNSSSAKSLTILYGSQTGNAKSVAKEYKAKLDALNVPAKIVSMADYKHKQLKTESHVVVIVSTHGEGEAPDDAVALHSFLAGKKAPKLKDLNFAVLGLGDTSYEFFCQTAKDFDKRLQDLGATRITDRVDCDVDYDADVTAWFETITHQVKDELGAKSMQSVIPSLDLGASSVVASQYTKKSPYTATLLESLKITGRDSVKDIRHIEISLEDSGIQYRPGDALGVWYKNDASLVAELISEIGLQSDTLVGWSGDDYSFNDVLVNQLELTQSYPTFVSKYAIYAKNVELNALLDDKSVLREYLTKRQIIDVVRQFPAKITAQQFVDALRSMTPRLYSIASSQAEVEDEVHLTVALVEYEAHGHTHQGGASSFLSTRLDEGGEVNVFVESNDNFRLPDDGNTAVIMIGPGTGIAPFRAFMQQREAEESSGENWLFFGNPNYTQDFLYQTEWQRFVKDGVVNKVSLAFSRDQEQKIYVQHRMLEQGAELYQWLERGAHLYVCGDANHMAKDVQDALVQIVIEHGAKSEEQAEQYVSDLRRAKRYQKDVY
ncbi:assimilatory sulfite reductase (NADPH) flavoprotein subunit [Paraglaciecola sp. MB-3u-78]|uniref:assimilatory sulfite reductase (NADPH) flavoprotein subunit n=1 Tax=Paraglaciecola sp. MB-3u-78 TaxID=2058332 RepID=UPI000C31E3D5|nr:assimilatory sulfite reductase (NADPH) flavoprotein subunit [Paraglaciecola sp. MB-3u-78]PKG97795.1 assimilatory sulfite reductase (NADPH) flavoprotein subunit [Paraglaciecola sp. MB-3u-78]